MKNLYIKDKNFRNFFKKNEMNNIFKKFVTTNFLNGIKKKTFKDSFFCNTKNKNFSKTKIRRRCVITNRSRGIQRPYNISRIKLRELMSFGILPGYKKSV